LGLAGSDGFCPVDGGTLELSGVFGGKPSFASSSATRAISASIRAKSLAIKASLSAKSGGGVIHRLTHIPDLAARKNAGLKISLSSHPQRDHEQLLEDDPSSQ
jgi:hypothetical protein